ncbi:histidine phosphatase family protein [Methylosinus sp. Sm6]|uniref:histidine phosphatase family protein n=1 Tax=Methylosinus sp. Sm6 TaxID=2866948 RepID=UPI001C99EBA9|nr:histidine phosphatase family protein [Methylosinus sp. Sm6]MBY6241372.1 histidine phosphatase family protein [Methylosinus sp. Sm6]
MRLILARHGNTFGPNDEVRWIGARADPPLVDKGREQAEAIGRALASMTIDPARILTAPLARTLESARLAAAAGGYSSARIEIEPRLIEIDYGAWEGRTSDEIRATRGAREIDAWERDGLWPQDAGWSPSETQLRSRIAQTLSSLRAKHADSDTILVVSSSGVLRCVGEICGLDRKSAKMRTGSLSIVRAAPHGFSIELWDRRPNERSPK